MAAEAKVSSFPDAEPSEEISEVLDAVAEMSPPALIVSPSLILSSALLLPVAQLTPRTIWFPASVGLVCALALAEMSSFVSALAAMDRLPVFLKLPSVSTPV